jgi:hypothetical protein
VFVNPLRHSYGVVFVQLLHTNGAIGVAILHGGWNAHLAVVDGLANATANACLVAPLPALPLHCFSFRNWSTVTRIAHLLVGGRIVGQSGRLSQDGVEQILR